MKADDFGSKKKLRLSWSQGEICVRILLCKMSVVTVIFAACQLNNISGKIINAASHSYADVNTAVASAAPGATVIVPEGWATWTSTLSYSKTGHHKGAGIGKTVINYTETAICATGQEGAQWTISGLEYVKSSSLSTAVAIETNGSCKNFRINNPLSEDKLGSEGRAVIIRVWVDGADHQYGLIDNCGFIDTRIWVEVRL